MEAGRLRRLPRKPAARRRPDILHHSEDCGHPVGKPRHRQPRRAGVCHAPYGEKLASGLTMTSRRAGSSLAQMRATRTPWDLKWTSTLLMMTLLRTSMHHLQRKCAATRPYQPWWHTAGSTTPRKADRSRVSPLSTHPVTCVEAGNTTFILSHWACNGAACRES